MTQLIFGAVQLGLIYALMAMGNYISFRILNIPDLTVDGSFALGMAVSVMTAAGGHPYLALFAAIIAGALAGLVTGLLQTKVGINPILAGILTMTALYSVNLFVMKGKANQSLIGKETVFSSFERLFKGVQRNIPRTILMIIVVALVAAILAVFFKTRLGMAIRATGDNEEMVRASSINADFTKCVGFALANACIALAGGLVCQYNQSADTGYGSGMLVVGLASVIIGEAVLAWRCDKRDNIGRSRRSAVPADNRARSEGKSASGVRAEVRLRDNRRRGARDAEDQGNCRESHEKEGRLT